MNPLGYICYTLAIGGAVTELIGCGGSQPLVSTSGTAWQS